MKFYIASKLENHEQVRYVSNALKSQGWTHTYEPASFIDKSRDRYGESLMGPLVKRKLEVGSCIVDLGAGTGYHSLSLEKEGYNVIAGDISVKMLQILSSKINTSQNVNVLPCKMNAYSSPLRDHSIDAFL